ncbi:MAG TPA: 16S rRNA (cytidine(1402)-2'-O)-methyltransferase [Anaerolineae bacterium]|nr:16S rRNA (cytidine(1402)-2'-O)-methyltransferase [Anaerolineae bacterium]
MGTLYIVPTPIGNLDDITLRAIKVLREASLIAAEDTRRAAILLSHFDLHTPVTSYFEHNKLSKLDRILSALEQGDVALISEAGTPGLSDPGYELICAAIERGYHVVPLPGATAAIPALVASGLPTDSFIFIGFLSRKAGDRKRALEEVKSDRRTLIFYEAPHRVRETLADMLGVLGDRSVCIARELSKVHEEIWRGSIAHAIEHFGAEALGEFVLVVAGAPEADRWDDDRVEAALLAEIEHGSSASEAARKVADMSGWNKRRVYALLNKE